MIGVALKGLAARKFRALLTALAVVIGVSMVSGTFVLTDTMQKAFDGIFEESYEGTDAVVNGKQLVEFSSGGRVISPRARTEALLTRWSLAPNQRWRGRKAGSTSLSSWGRLCSRKRSGQPCGITRVRNAGGPVRRLAASAEVVVSSNQKKL